MLQRLSFFNILILFAFLNLHFISEETGPVRPSNLLNSTQPGNDRAEILFQVGVILKPMLVPLTMLLI